MVRLNPLMDRGLMELATKVLVIHWSTAKAGGTKGGENQSGDGVDDDDFLRDVVDMIGIGGDDVSNDVGEGGGTTTGNEGDNVWMIY